MANWTDLSAAFAFGTKLTSQQMQQLRDNITALSEGAAGAPDILEAAYGANSVDTTALKTGTGENNQVGEGNVGPSGGTYAFYPEVKVTGGDGPMVRYTNTSYSRSFACTVDTGSPTFFVQNRYVTASGEVFWIYFLIDKKTKKIVATCAQPDHCCMGYGGDPARVPHPFIDYNAKNHDIIIVNPAFEQVEKIISEAEAGEWVLETIEKKYKLVLDDTLKWPDIPVTVGIASPDFWTKDKAAVIKKVIPRLDYFKLAKLEKR